MDSQPSPTPREMQILKVIWDLGPCSVRDVHKRLNQLEAEDLAYNTVQTLLRIMDEKGLVAHELLGRTFVYSSRYSRDESASRFLDRVFDGATDQLVLSLLRSERISTKELEKLHALIEQARDKPGKRKPRPKGEVP